MKYLNGRIDQNVIALPHILIPTPPPARLNLFDAFRTVPPEIGDTRDAARCLSNRRRPLVLQLDGVTSTTSPTRIFPERIRPRSRPTRR
jgi:hypothetical protein